MKAKDLMIGDWVMDARSNTPLRVNPFLALQEVPEWETLPLTPEILEKNGFRWDGSGQREMMCMTPYDAKGIRYHIYVGFKYKTMNVFSTFPEHKSPNWRKHNRVDLEVIGLYVHELQHALRLCGLDDLADNFKI